MTLWRNPAFVRLWAAATVSTFGSLLTGTALAFATVLTLGADSLDVGLLSIAELLPGFAIGLLAGAWIDQLPGGRSWSLRSSSRCRPCPTVARSRPTPNWRSPRHRAPRRRNSATPWSPK